LASGGNDNTVCIWDNLNRNPLHTFNEHRAAVKAIRWCPWQRHVLATGGGTADRRVCLWNAASGRLLAAADAESQVTGVLWSLQEKELLTAHGYSRNQLTLWNYPSLAKAADLEGHSGRLLGMAQSPDGSIVCSSAADETLRFWRVFSPASGDKRSSDRIAPNSIMKTIR
jgi:cell division cycle protein 20 (cofactor of APC complex)